MPRIKSLPSPLSGLKNCFPFSEKTIDALERRLTNIRWPFMLINGPHSTGKSDITRALLETLKVEFSWTNCLEISSLKMLQSKILYDVDVHSGFKSKPKFKSNANTSNEETEESPKKSSYLKGQTNDSFADHLKENIEFLMAFKSTKPIKKTPSKRMRTNEPAVITPTFDRFFIVLDNYDKLVDSGINILPALNEVHEKLKGYISVITIMISTIYYDRLIQNFSSIPKPLSYIFPSYTATSFPTILSRLASETPDQTYTEYCKAVSDTLSFSINDLNKLSFICEQSFLDSLDANEGSDDIHKLRKCFLENAEDYVQEAITLGNSSNMISSKMEELPKSAKYLLVASYLASSSTKASDKKYFVIASDKRKVTRNTSKKEPNVGGPKLFTLERLLHIYESLVYLNEEGDLKGTYLNEPTNQLLSQIETLVSFKLLIKVGSVTISFLSSLTKYQISDFVTFELIDHIANSLGISLKDYSS